MPGTMRNRQRLTIAGASCFGHKDFARTVKILRCQGVRLFHLHRRTLEDHPSATAAATWSYVYNIIRLGHYVTVVFDDYDRIAGISQLLQR